MIWQVEWTRPALKDAALIPLRERRHIIAAVEDLAATERGNLRRIKALKKTAPLIWRLRVGEYRVFTHPGQDGKHVASLARGNPQCRLQTRQKLSDVRIRLLHTDERIISVITHMRRRPTLRLNR